jgi:hypothetical protein
MAARSTAATLIPPDAPLDELARIAVDCTACHLHRTGTQTVFGEGPVDAAVVLVGEQPGEVTDGVTALLEDLTVADLRGFATTLGLRGWRGSRKAALVERLTAELGR